MVKQKAESIFLFSLFFLSAVYSLWAVHVGWHHSITEAHSFRQTQTAFSAYWLTKGGSWVAYQTPLLGAPWSIPMEFPFYQWCVVVAMKVFSLPLIEAGRLVGVFFFYLSLVPLYFILKNFVLEQKYILVFLILFITAPLHLFWSRTFMIESTALFFSLSYLSFAIYFLEKKNTSFAVYAAIFGILAGMIKVTTFVTFLFAVAIYCFVKWRDHLSIKTSINFLRK